ncbi:MAG: ABC transporter permease [Acidobacteriota bacterium]
MSTFFYDLRHGVRQLVKRPSLTILILLTLALGIGANSAIYSVIQGVLFETAPFDEVDRLVWIGEHSEQIPNMSVSYPNFLDWRERNRSFEAVAAHRYGSFNLTGDGRAEQLTAVFASASLFHDVLRVEPLHGRVFSAEEDQAGRGAVTLVSHAFWQRRLGGDPAAIGRKLLLDGEPFEIIGVMQPEFMYPLFTNRVSLWVPIGHWADASFMESRGNHPGIYVTGRLAEGVSFDQSRDDMVSIAAALEQEFPGSNSGHGVAMDSVRETVVQFFRPALLLLGGAVVLVLLIACVNVANLLLARGTARVQEMAVRSALGASHGRVVRQLLTESVLLSVIGGLAGVFVATLGVKLLATMEASQDLPVVGEAEVDSLVLTFTFVLSVVTGLVFGLAPAVQALRQDLIGPLKDGAKGTQGGARQWFKNALVVSQVAFAVVLLVGAFLFLQSFRNLVQADPGFDPEGVLAIELALPESEYPEDAEQTALISALVERVRGLPGVESASNTLPLLGGWQTSFVIEGRPAPAPGDELSVDITRVGPDYFETFGVDLQKGRVIDARDRADSVAVAVIDRTFADLLFPGQDPIGQRVKTGTDPGAEDRPWIEIVGVVDHVKNYGVDAESRVEIYLPSAQSEIGRTTLLVKTSLDEPTRLVPQIEAELAGLSTTVPLANPRTVLSDVGRHTLADRMVASLLSVFAAVAMALAALGIYGVLAFHVERNRREIGIRMALGAARSRVARWVATRGLRLVAMGLVFGLGLGALLVAVFGQPIRDQLFGVELWNPVALLGVPAVLAVVALLASWAPIRRATGVEPTEALRYE